MPLSEVEKETLLAFEMFKTYKKGEVIFKNRQIPDSSYFIQNMNHLLSNVILLITHRSIMSPVWRIRLFQ